MIKASFIIRGDYANFLIKGHSGSAPKGEDIVCAAVSSAALMTANTVTEVLKKEVRIVEKDGYLSFETSGSDAAADIVRGLELHLRALSDEYPGFIKITTEV